MKSIMMRGNRVHVEEVPRPVPGLGQVLVKTRACGICGSDLHLIRHAPEIFDFYAEIGIVDANSSNKTLELSLGHEFCAEIVAFGPETLQSLAIGSRVTSTPFLMTGESSVGVGVTPGVHGAYSEYFLLSESILLPVPENVPDEAAALTEPLAVGLHAVNVAGISSGEVALVAGCGPIGLACITALKRQGVEQIIASDPSAQARELAESFGAAYTVNPLDSDEMQIAAELAADVNLVILECVGIPSMIPDFILRAPEHACIVFTGLHTSAVSINPAHALVKQLTLKFSYYYTPEEFAECLGVLATGDLDWRALITGKVGIDGVPAAFAELQLPNRHIKVVVEPWRTGHLETIKYRDKL